MDFCKSSLHKQGSTLLPNKGFSHCNDCKGELFKKHEKYWDLISDKKKKEKCPFCCFGLEYKKEKGKTIVARMEDSKCKNCLEKEIEEKEIKKNHFDSPYYNEYVLSLKETEIALKKFEENLEKKRLKELDDILL